eukprot:g721.t1
MYGWRFVGLEIDPISFESAKKNVEINDLSRDIELRLVRKNEGGVLDPALLGTDRVDFSMCNPPFYGSAAEKSAHPSRCCVSTTSESIYEAGGEIGFVSRIIDDSLKFKRRVRWYTSMIGRKKSLKNLLRRLREEKDVREVCTYTFRQGQTDRWGLAWSFFDVEDARLFVSADVCDMPATMKRKDAYDLLTRTKHFALPYSIRVTEARQRAENFFVAHASAETCGTDDRDALTQLKRKRGNKKGQTWSKGFTYEWQSTSKDAAYEARGRIASCDLHFRFLVGSKVPRRGVVVFGEKPQEETEKEEPSFVM